MADYPATIPTFREILNLPNEAYDENKKTTIYAEDFNTLRAEVIAITEAIGVQLENIYPVGCIIEFGDADTSPATRGMNGTWVRHCEGRAHVSLEAMGIFDIVGEELGEDEVTLTTSEMPTHTHTQNSHNHTQNAHNHGVSHENSTYKVGGGGVGANVMLDPNLYGFNQFSSDTVATNNATTATNNDTGGGGGHNNIQRSIVVVCWIRTA